MLDNFLNFLGNILSIKHFLGWYEIFFCLAICVGIFFLGHLCCMISFSVVTALQEIFFSILPTPPQRSNGPPLSVFQHTGCISTYMLHVSLPFIHFRTTTKIRRVQVISAKFLLVITLITVTDNSIRLLISRLQDLAAQKVL